MVNLLQTISFQEIPKFPFFPDIRLLPTDQCQRDSRVECRDCGPLAGALLSGGVPDLVEQEASVLVPELKDVAGNLHQVRVELTLVPLIKHLSEGKKHTQFRL